MISKIYQAWLALQAIYGNQGAFDEILRPGVDVWGLKTVNGALTATPLGTVDWPMWESNFKVEPTEDPLFGPIHTGFRDAGNLAYAMLQPKFFSAKAAGLDIYIQGHSRGGSLADYVSAKCAQDMIEVHTAMFEAAPIGQQKYIDWCASKVKEGMINVEISTTNGIDPVPYSDDVLGYIPTYETANLDFPPPGAKRLIPTEWHMEDLIYEAMLTKYPNG